MQGNFNHSGMASAVKEQNMSLFTWATVSPTINSQSATGQKLNVAPNNYKTVKLAQVTGGYQTSQPKMSMTGFGANVSNGQKLQRSYPVMMMRQPTMGKSTLQIKQPSGMMGLTQLPPNQFMRHNFSASTQNIPQRASKVTMFAPSAVIPKSQSKVQLAQTESIKDEQRTSSLTMRAIQGGLATANKRRSQGTKMQLMYNDCYDCDCYDGYGCCQDGYYGPRRWGYGGGYGGYYGGYRRPYGGYGRYGYYDYPYYGGGYGRGYYNRGYYGGGYGYGGYGRYGYGGGRYGPYRDYYGW